ncbi:unnamed protein product, partial [Didymodactylos carnosus]
MDNFKVFQLIPKISALVLFVAAFIVTGITANTAIKLFIPQIIVGALSCLRTIESALVVVGYQSDRPIILYV